MAPIWLMSSRRPRCVCGQGMREARSHEGVCLHWGYWQFASTRFVFPWERARRCCPDPGEGHQPGQMFRFLSLHPRVKSTLGSHSARRFLCCSALQRVCSVVRHCTVCRQQEDQLGHCVSVLAQGIPDKLMCFFLKLYCFWDYLQDA